MHRRIKEKQSGGMRHTTNFTLPKGDNLDNMISNYINQVNCPVPIRKIGNGFYLFGTKKIYAKILNGKLVIRVGGGYMIIEEFIAVYADQEMVKISKLSDEQLLELAGKTQEMRLNVDDQAKLSMYRSNTTKMRPSQVEFNYGSGMKRKSTAAN